MEDFFFFSWIGLAASQINIPFIFQFLWIWWLLLILFSIVDTDRRFSRISWVPSFVIYHNSSFTRTVCIGSDILTCTGPLLLSNFASCYLWAVCINRSFDSLLNHVFISFGALCCKQKMAMGNQLLSRSQFLIMTLDSGYSSILDVFDSWFTNVRGLLDFHLIYNGPWPAWFFISPSKNNLPFRIYLFFSWWKVHVLIRLMIWIITCFGASGLLYWYLLHSEP